MATIDFPSLVLPERSSQFVHASLLQRTKPKANPLVVVLVSTYEITAFRTVNSTSHYQGLLTQATSLSSHRSPTKRHETKFTPRSFSTNQKVNTIFCTYFHCHPSQLLFLGSAREARTKPTCVILNIQTRKHRQRLHVLAHDVDYFLASRHHFVAQRSILPNAYRYHTFY